MANGALMRMGNPPSSVQEASQGSAPQILQMSDTERAAHAKEVMDRHVFGLQKRRLRDLTAEKYLLHVDGENDGQYAEIVDGFAVIVEPRNENSIRWQRNLLRPLMDNTVAYHTSIPFRVVAKAAPGRRERDRGRVDTLLANHLITINNLNSKLAHAMYIAGCYGHCPMHGTWRRSGTDGYVEFWVGDPWGTVYDDAATRNKIHRYSYEMILRTESLKNSFQGLPGIDKLTGRKDLPSSSRFQRIVRRWQYENQHLSGSAVINSGYRHGDELSIVLIDETLPGVSPMWPQGRLMITALDGSATIEPWSMTTNTSNPILLHVGPLPAQRPSAERFYSVYRHDDVLGKAYIADLSPLQQQLNQIVSLRAERLKRYSTPQLMAKNGAIEDDAIIADPEYVLTVNSPDYPTFLNPPTGTPDYDALQSDTESQMFRIGGWQAASRGEAYAGDPAAKVVALAKADDTIFGPMNRDFQDSLCRLLALGHALHREFAQKPVIANVTGEEMSYIADPWIRNNQLSREDPRYVVVSGFGATPESLAQSLMTLVTTATADGMPLLSWEEFWEKHPDMSLRPHMPGSSSMKRMRLNALNYHIEGLCMQAEEEYRDFVNQNPKILPQLAQFILQEVNFVFPVLRTDNPNVCIASLDELVHDVTSSSLVRMVAEMRQAIYFEWIQSMMDNNSAPFQEEPEPSPRRSGGGGTGTPRGTNIFGGTRNSEVFSPQKTKNEVERLTSAATTGGESQ